MTRASLREYAAVQRERYQGARRRDKQRLLDELVAVTGMHRKAAIRMLRRPAGSEPARPRSGRPRQYGPAVAAAAEVLWQASGRIGAHRLHPFVPELLDRLTQCDELRLAPAVDKLVRQVSRPTLARLLEGARAQYPRRGASTTHPSSWLKQQIPIRTFADWDDARPGFCQVDLVAHCGSSTKGFYLHTLCAVDVATSWVELQALWGKGHSRVAAGVQAVRTRLPVVLAGLDSDNGSEFINRVLYYYCWREGIVFTRGRAWKKNDSALVEQKNGAIVRHLVGYDRFASQAAYAQLARVYALVRLHVNFFQPVEKLVTKRRDGARVHRLFDRAQTPYQRLCAAGVLVADKRAELEGLYQRLNPLQLQRDIEAALERLWKLAAPDPARAVMVPSVTLTNELTEPGG
ncbi:MAG TPA: hypothetical protein VHT71_06045 [Methylomirabilota bacterium]|nr:hypothetical protein [Methylomirabilota bacterium]